MKKTTGNPGFRIKLKSPNRITIVSTLPRMTLQQKLRQPTERPSFESRFPNQMNLILFWMHLTKGPS